MSGKRWVTVLACAAAFVPAAAGAQAPARAEGLGAYTGMYAYHGGQTIVLATADRVLVAVLDEAKYPLRTLGRDRFLNGVGDTIPFRRGADGRVTGFVEGGTFYARLADTVPARIATLLRPRAPGPDGRVAPYVYQRPADLGDGLAVGDLAAAGLDSATAARIAGGVLDGTWRNVHGILVYRRGRLVMEEYFYGFDRERTHQMRSATKSVVSAMAGAAVDRGLLSVTDRAMPRLGVSGFANPDPRKQSITLADLLTMRSGLACDDWNDASPGNQQRVDASGDWVKFMLDLPMASDPGTAAHYCSGGVYLAGRMVERAAGEPLPAFAQRVLWTPLGIHARDVRWNFTLDSSNTGYAQVHLRPRDMLKFGVLFHQGGEWGGRQVLSREWVRQSMAPATRIGDMGYGYYWWHQYLNVQTPGGPPRVDMILASGNGGQKIYLVPELDLVAVFTGGNYNEEENSPPNAIMARVLLPALLRGR